MKQFKLLFLSFIIFQNLHSQNEKFSVGFDFGLTNSSAVIKNSHFNEKYDYKSGIITGFNLGYKFNNGFYIQTNINYNEMGYQVSNKLKLNENSNAFSDALSYAGYEVDKSLLFLSNSWLVGYKLGSKFGFIANTGICWSYLIIAKYQSKDYFYIDPSEYLKLGFSASEIGYSENKNTEYGKGMLSDFDLGIVSTLGIFYNLNHLYSIDLNVFYYRGFLDIVKQNFFFDAGYNRSYNVFVGFKRKL